MCGDHVALFLRVSSIMWKPCGHRLANRMKYMCRTIPIINYCYKSFKDKLVLISEFLLKVASFTVILLLGPNEPEL
jgi:uncharacterized membrane protein